jgi:hypothetical protein
MALEIRRSVGSTGIPVWQGKGKDMQIVQGGFALVATSLPRDTILPAGSPVTYDEAARTATVYGGGILQAAATGSPTTYRLIKGAPVKVGDVVALSALGTGAGAFAITALDVSNAAYDLITVGTTLGNAAVGTGLYISSATGASASAYPTGINGLLYEDTFGNPGESVSVVIRGTAYARRIPAYSAGLAALTGLKNIIFSQSK